MYFFALIIFKLLAVLPLKAVRGLGAGLGWAVYHCAPKTRQTVSEHLQQAQLTVSVKAVVQASVQGLLETAWVWFNSQARVVAHCTLDPNSAVSATQALSGAQATLLITPHLGCFEALVQWAVTRRPITAMYRRPDKAWLARLVDSGRNATGLTMVQADESGVRSLLKQLKSGGTIGLLPDQAPRVGEGVWLPWFGRDAYTITLPAKLQARTQAAVFVFAAIPNASGWQIVCEPIMMRRTADMDTDITHNTLAINHALEALIRHNPLHYAWTYRRYKGSKGNKPR